MVRAAVLRFRDVCMDAFAGGSLRGLWRRAPMTIVMLDESGNAMNRNGGISAAANDGGWRNSKP